ncbi:MAG: hypothetical protein NTW86_12405 [Candidatus Sumerlaeota bacterium]|nr:hypothetical protein [Candidatus Sumerlaeota bacterium]
MTTREMIQAEIGKIPEDRLSELYGIIRTFVASNSASSRPGIMTKLRQIRIQGPADFATNLDLYLSGEKSADEDLH